MMLFPKFDLLAFKNILCIQPHPDDNEVAAGATIAQLAAKGASVTYLTVTDGGYGCASSEEALRIVSVRREEALSAAKVLGVKDCLFMDYPDLGFHNPRQLMMDIISVIRETKPDLVMCADPWLPYEAHPDHSDVGLASVRACLFASSALLDGGTPWSVDAVALYYSARPNTFIDCQEEYASLKKRALLCHASQFTGDVWTLVESYLEDHMRANGARAGTEHAEAFKVLPLIAFHAVVEAENL